MVKKSGSGSREVRVIDADLIVEVLYFAFAMGEKMSYKSSKGWAKV